MGKTKSSRRRKGRGTGETATRRSHLKRVTRARPKITMPSRRKVIIISSVIAVILFISFPFWVILAKSPPEANYLHWELAYRHISDEVTRNCENDLEKAITLNSFMFLSEDTGRHCDVLYHSPYFDLVRHIGYCDQKARGLVHLLEKQDIEAKGLGFECHSVAGVLINDTPRFFDPHYNCYFVYKDNRERVATLKEVLNDNDRLMTNNGKSFSEYRGRCIATSEFVGILIDTEYYYEYYHNKMSVRAMEFYYHIGGVFFCNLFQDFHFFIMEKFRGGKVADTFGTAYGLNVTERQRNEHESEAYFDLYKARNYHLFGNFQKADMIYDSLLNSGYFKDDALFFKTKILLQTRKFSELREYISNICDEYGEDITGGAGGYEIRYLFFIERYLEKFCSVENQQLQNIFHFTQPEINEVKRIYEELF